MRCRPLQRTMPALHFLVHGRAFIAAHGMRRRPIGRHQADAGIAIPLQSRRVLERCGWRDEAAQRFLQPSGCRDLLFQARSIRRRGSEIAAFLDAERLGFLGFDADAGLQRRYAARFPSDAAKTDLASVGRCALQSRHRARAAASVTAKRRSTSPRRRASSRISPRPMRASGQRCSRHAIRRRRSTHLRRALALDPRNLQAAVNLGRPRSRRA